MIHDPATLRLGRPLPPRQDVRTLRFATYLPADMPKAPSSVDYGTKVRAWGMLGNDRYGNCTCVSLLHMFMIWLSQNGFNREYTVAEALDLYIRLCGFDPARPEATDNGGVELDILKAWRKEPIEGIQLLAFASVDPMNWEHVKLAHWLAGTLYMGVSLPTEAQNEKIWSSTTGTPGTWGGHAINSVAYQEKGGWQCAAYIEAITWGERKKITPKWLAKYCDELWVPITPSWFGPNGLAPNGFNLALLRQHVAQVSHLAA